jgi:hypothetical protein
VKVLVIALVLAAASTAEASPAWWQQFYVYAGYREVDGLDRASGRTLAIGYREERDGWGLDLAALDHVDGLDEGLHQLLRFSAYGKWRNLWLGGGLSYSVLDGWTQTAVPHRSGQGIGVDVIGGVDLPGWKFVRPFIQLDVTVPTFGAYDRYGSTDTMERAIGIEIAFGLRL